MTAVVLQARLDSTRLPGKALLPLGGEPLVFRVMEALKGVPAGLHILACPDDALAAFTPLAERAGFEIMAGPKEDVLARYCAVIRRFGLTRVIRATGDNPFVFADAAAALNDEAAALDADYAGYTGLPYGAGVESVAASALLRAEKEAVNQPEREHVCPYLYGHGELFFLHRPLVPARWRGPNIRITVDTAEDLRRAERLWALLRTAGHKPDGFRGEAVIRAAAAL